MNLEIENTACFTGHRPSSLNGYVPLDNKELIWEIYYEIERLYFEEDIDTFISGMALGVDTWAAESVIAHRNNGLPIRLISAIPCKNHSKMWKKPDQLKWQEIVDKSDHHHYVTEQEYTKTCMHERNKWMVDRSDIIIAVWNGQKYGGTYQTVKYAEEKDKEIINIYENLGGNSLSSN